MSIENQINKNTATKESVDRDFLSSQLKQIQSITYKRIAVFSFVLVVVIILLYVVVYHSITSIIGSSHLADILSPSTQKELKELWQESYIETGAPDIFYPETLSRVQSYISSIDQDLSQQQLKQLTDISISSYAYTVDSIPIGVVLLNTVDRDRLSSQFFIQNGSKYFRFVFNNNLNISTTPFIYKVSEQVGSELERKIKEILLMKPEDEVSTKIIAENFRKIKFVFESEIYNDSFYLSLKAMLKNKVDLLKSALESNSSLFNRVNERIKSIIESEKENVKSYIGSNVGLQPYLMFTQRSLLSLLLVTISITLLFLIKSEISLIAKTQSLVILAGGMNFSLEGLNLFDAVDRLHSGKGMSNDIQDIIALLKERKKLTG